MRLRPKPPLNFPRPGRYKYRSRDCLEMEMSRPRLHPWFPVCHFIPDAWIGAGQLKGSLSYIRLCFQIDNGAHVEQSAIHCECFKRLRLEDLLVQSLLLIIMCHVLEAVAYATLIFTSHNNNNQTACADFPNVVAQCHIFGGVHPGFYDPQIRTWRRFLYNAPTHEVSSSCVYSFGSYHVDKQTNRRRWKHPSFFAALRCWLIMSRDHLLVLSLVYTVSFLMLFSRVWVGEWRHRVCTEGGRHAGETCADATCVSDAWRWLQLHVGRDPTSEPPAELPEESHRSFSQVRHALSSLLMMVQTAICLDWCLLNIVVTLPRYESRLLRSGCLPVCVSVRLCLCVYLSVNISLEPLDRPSRNLLCRSPVAVTRSCSGGVAIRYVLSV